MGRAVVLANIPHVKWHIKPRLVTLQRAISIVPTTDRINDSIGIRSQCLLSKFNSPLEGIS